MAIIASLCEAYHWTLEEAFKLTTPQIILLSHISSEQAKKYRSNSSNKRFDYTQNINPDRLVDNKTLDPVVYRGQKLSEVSKDFDKLVSYLSPLTNINAM